MQTNLKKKAFEGKIKLFFLGLHATNSSRGGYFPTRDILSINIKALKNYQQRDVFSILQKRIIIDFKNNSIINWQLKKKSKLCPVNTAEVEMQWLYVEKKVLNKVTVIPNLVLN